MAPVPGEARLALADSVHGVTRGAVVAVAAVPTPRPAYGNH